MKMFLLLDDADLLDVFLDESECLLDPFSKSWFGKIRDDTLSVEDAMFCLRALATHWKLDIADIESRHAAVRRLLKTRHKRSGQLQHR